MSIQAQFQSTSLKRDKHSFQSTALHTMKSTRTAPKAFVKPQLSVMAMEASQKLRAKTQMPQNDKILQKIQVKSIIESITISIAEEQATCKRQATSKFMRHFYYRAISRVVKHPLLTAPRIVQDLYSQKMLERLDKQSCIGFNQGYLKAAGCVYYAIENTIIFIRIEDLIDMSRPSINQVPFVIYEVRNQVVGISEITGGFSLFPNHDLILAISHPWQIEFYAWQFGNKIVSQKQDSRDVQIKSLGLKSLNFVYKLPTQKIESLDSSTDGRIFFFDEQGYLHQMTPKQETSFFIYKTGKFTIKNHVNSSQNTFQLLSQKHGKFSPILNIVSNIGQFSKYFFPSKIEAPKVLCDKRKNLLFALLKKKIKFIFGHEYQTFVVCYNIQKKAKLIHKFSEKLFIDKVRSHVPKKEEIRNDEVIQSIHLAPAYYNNANLIVVTKSGAQIVMQILQNDAKISEIIKPPDHRMFESELDSKGCQFLPKDTTQYNLLSFIQDEQKSMCTVMGQKGAVMTYLTSSIFSSEAIDVSQQAISVDLQIYKQSSTNVRIHKIDESKLLDYVSRLDTFNNYGGYISELTTQTLLPPSLYLFQAKAQIQLIHYLRPIDILFTAIFVLSEPQTQNFSYKNLTKDSLILKIFLSSSLSFSLVGNVYISIEQLCAMIVQILVDKDGLYFFSSDAAVEMFKIWERMKQESMGKFATQPTGRISSYSEERENYHNSNKARADKMKYSHKVSDQIHSFCQISKRFFIECRDLLENLSIQGPELLHKYKSKKKHGMRNKNQCFYDFNDIQVERNEILKSKIITFKIGTIIKYLSRLLQQIWNVNISDIHRSTKILMIRKLQYLHVYVKQVQGDMKVYHGEAFTSNYFHVNRQIHELGLSISKCIELFLLMENVPLLPESKTLGCCLREDETIFEEFMFRSIQRQLRPFIIQKWKSLFPHFVSSDFERIVKVYAEVEEIMETKKIISELKSLSTSLHFPQYFINYLIKIKRFSDEQVSYILSLSEKTKRFSNDPEGNDHQFSIPEKILKMSKKYSKDSKLSEPDENEIAKIFKNGVEQQKYTISNKRSLAVFIKVYLPVNEKIKYLINCITTQYDLYCYYVKVLEGNSKTSKLYQLLNKGNNQLKQNSETMALLRLSSILDHEKLQKLVLLTADYEQMSNFHVVFENHVALAKVYKSICQEESIQKHKSYSSFANYIEKYLLNFALRSEHSRQVLDIVCRVTDTYIQTLDFCKQEIESFINFASKASITNKLIFLPQLLIKIGYSPQAIFQVYLKQLQGLFNRSVSLQNQHTYILKFMNCCYLIKKYLTLESFSFTKIMSMHLDAFTRTNIANDKAIVGISKILDEIVCKKKK